MGYAELSMENLKLATKVQMLERESRHYRDRNKELNRQILTLKDNNKQLTSDIDCSAKETYRLSKDNCKLEDEKWVLNSRIKELEESVGIAQDAINASDKAITSLKADLEAAREEAKTKDFAIGYLQAEVNRLTDQLKKATETGEADASKSDQIFQKIGDALGLQGKIFEDWSFCSIFGVIEEMNASAVTDMVRVASMELERQKLLTKLEAAEETRDEAIKKYSDLSERYDRAADKLNETYVCHVGRSEM